MENILVKSMKLISPITNIYNGILGRSDSFQKHYLWGDYRSKSTSCSICLGVWFPFFIKEVRKARVASIGGSTSKILFTIKNVTGQVARPFGKHLKQLILLID